MIKTYIILKTGRSEYTKIKVEEIFYLKADGNYTHIICCEPEKIITICKNLKSTISIIDSDLLIRISRSIAINYKHIKALKAGKSPEVLLNNNQKINISHKILPQLKELFIHSN